eukprot:7359488-Alexandrium_andersonii.AAC.1
MAQYPPLGGIREHCCDHSWARAAQASNAWSHSASSETARRSSPLVPSKRGPPLSLIHISEPTRLALI